MIYHVVLFLKPEPVDGTGALKYRVSRAKFERICDPEVVMIQFEENVYRMDDKKIFSIEKWNDGKEETTDSLLVCEAHKVNRHESWE